MLITNTSECKYLVQNCLCKIHECLFHIDIGLCTGLQERNTVLLCNLHTQTKSICYSQTHMCAYLSMLIKSHMYTCWDIAAFPWGLLLFTSNIQSSFIILTIFIYCFFQQTIFRNKSGRNLGHWLDCDRVVHSWWGGQTSHSLLCFRLPRMEAVGEKLKKFWNYPSCKCECECVWERESEYACVPQCARTWERKCLCSIVCVHMRESEHACATVCMCGGKRKLLSHSVHAHEREREYACVPRRAVMFSTAWVRVH